MKIKHRPLTAESMKGRTYWADREAEETISWVNRMTLDEDREARIACGECPRCFYLRRSRIGGSAMTSWRCGICAKQDTHGSTAVPDVCLECSKKYKLCTNCGGDRELRRNRRKWPEAHPFVEDGDDE